MRNELKSHLISDLAQRARWLAPIRRAQCGLLLALLLAGCEPPGRPDSKDRPVPANQIVDFGILYRQNCAGCHGANGSLGPAPPLADPIFLAIVPDKEIESVLMNGRPGTPMPAFTHLRGGPLTDEQVKALASGLKPHWEAMRAKPSAPLPEDLPPYSSPKVASSDKTAVSRGEEAFARACAACHGSHGQGNELAGAIHDRDFLSLISDQALRRLIITGRPDLDMPNYAGTSGRGDDFRPLSSDEIDDVVALLAQWRSGVSE